MNIQKLQKRRKGFTLVELLIVMAIIGILALIAIPKFTQSTESAKMRTMHANTRVLASAVVTYLADNSGTMPTNIEELITKDYLAKGTFGTNGTTGTQPDSATYAVDSANGFVIGTLKVKSGAAGVSGVIVSGDTATARINVLDAN